MPAAINGNRTPQCAGNPCFLYRLSAQRLVALAETEEFAIERPQISGYAFPGAIRPSRHMSRRLHQANFASGRQLGWAVDHEAENPAVFEFIRPPTFTTAQVKSNINKM